MHQHRANWIQAVIVTAAERARPCFSYLGNRGGKIWLENMFVCGLLGFFLWHVLDPISGSAVGGAGQAEHVAWQRPLTAEETGTCVTPTAAHHEASLSWKDREMWRSKRRCLKTTITTISALTQQNQCCNNHYLSKATIKQIHGICSARSRQKRRDNGWIKLLSLWKWSMAAVKCYVLKRLWLLYLL